MFSHPALWLVRSSVMLDHCASCRAQRSGMPVITEPLISRTVVWGWADVVIFPSITASALSSDYTAIEDDMETFIDGGGKMVIMGSISLEPKSTDRQLKITRRVLV